MKGRSCACEAHDLRDSRDLQMAITRFEDLEVWQEPASLAVEVYTASKNGDFNQDFSLRDQLRRSAVSIAANIAEGKKSASLASRAFLAFLARRARGGP